MTSTSQETNCARRFSCERYRSYVISTAVLAEDGKPPEYRPKEHCIGIIAQGMVCPYFPKHDGEDGPSVRRGRYSLPDG